MKIKILSATSKTWYKDAVGEIFDVEYYTHPTFKSKSYTVLDTESNRKYFKGDELSLSILKDGLMGVKLNHADIVFEPDSIDNSFY
ncbi:hypothetical protein ACDN41_12045 [Priestia aryabhattai]|uniref:hypothetical protein n=1 Tax=Priestia aryabhattai TaxID=412384 RepID=UPI003531F71B